MITDKQGREWLLQKMYDDGCRDINVHYGKVKFFIEKDGYVDTTYCVPANILGYDDRDGYIDIAEELGIVDWSKVAVDTPIYVREHESNDWEKRHFAFFKNGKVYSWLSGVTSWTADDKNYVFSWRYAKLAEV